MDKTRMSADVEAMCERWEEIAGQAPIGNLKVQLGKAAAMLRLLAQRIENILNIQFKTTAETVKQIQREQAAWQQQLDSLSKDAERYRWLRDEVHGPHIPLAQVVWKLNNIRDSGEWTNLADGTSLDAAIDTVLAAKEQL